MSKILHIVKEARGGYQIRETPAAGEGEGAGQHTECKDWTETASLLREKGAGDDAIKQAASQLEGADNAEIRC